MTTQPNSAPDAEREAFEKWAEDNLYDTNRKEDHEDEYDSFHTQIAWEGFQAGVLHARKVPDGLIDRIKSAQQRIQDNHAPRRIPADPTDVDLVLKEVEYFLTGQWPPFWIKDADPSVVPQPTGEGE